MQQQFLRSIGIKRKRSSMFMPVIEAFDKTTRYLLTPWIGSTQASLKLIRTWPSLVKKLSNNI
jgi:hypothetical protein